MGMVFVQRSVATPLWPAGHLPLKGGDRLAATSRHPQVLVLEASPCVLQISPLEGEMPGRAEGGKLHAAFSKRWLP
ncbi:hypothetical protein PMI07_003170 [Rhizobium sp. CF080]|nr:hypothetical protein PMI07_003170 [Rhizobium sp. CF080]